MREAEKTEKEGRTLVQFWLPNYVHSKIKGEVGDVNGFCQLFARQFSQGKAKVQITMEKPKGK